MATKKKAAKKKAKKPAAKKTVKKASKKAKPKSKRKPNAAFMKPLMPSTALGVVVGSRPLARTEAVKRIWAHIKKNKLQDNKNRRMINTDAALKAVFGNKGQVSMFDVAKYLGKHLS
ncbi:MAG: SWIB/MDM2 domain-containing protein [Bacteroidota bacterium]